MNEASQNLPVDIGMRVEVELDNGQYVIANVINRGTRSLPTLGEHVQVGFIEGGLRAYQIPTHGLESELALE